ncbi:type VI secretion system protein ImpL [Enterobacter cloacae]|uniref:Type VI secretion system protein ImpL n=1 Tax=Enterobacter cloacae TaxID=550 RepID=A0A377LZM9_ENTCL|nr:type VI secretion system protein ImpL [Enterobacter cloacae]
MFSLPEKKTAGTSASTADAEQYIPGSQRHALTLPAIWQGTVDDCPAFVAAVSVWRGSRRLPGR